MGLNYNYLLYFKREHLWDALRGVAAIADPVDPPPTTIHFTDHDLVLPIATDYGQPNELPHDRPEYKFALSLVFEADDAILEYLRSGGFEEAYRAPPDPDGVKRVAIGLIYLTVYADLAQHWAFKKPVDLVLFRFGTTGTRMSMLFEESASIRRTFVGLLERCHGVCGILDLEVDYGQLFWFRGRQVEASVWDVYTLPEEIEEMLERGGEWPKEARRDCSSPTSWPTPSFARWHPW
ncbi:MAG TPA: hypothetical protein PKO09_10795 [Anaerolineae bacterium]|nr:hypothetical protein [Anaerolineae bacterium]